MIRTRDPQIASLPFNQLSYVESYKNSTNNTYKLKVIFIVYFERKYVKQWRCPIPP